MAFVMVLSYSRAIYLRFFLDARMECIPQTCQFAIFGKVGGAGYGCDRSGGSSRKASTSSRAPSSNGLSTIRNAPDALRAARGSPDSPNFAPMTNGAVMRLSAAMATGRRAAVGLNRCEEVC